MTVEAVDRKIKAVLIEEAHKIYLEVKQPLNKLIENLGNQLKAATNLLVNASVLGFHNREFLLRDLFAAIVDSWNPRNLHYLEVLTRILCS